MRAYIYHRHNFNMTNSCQRYFKKGGEYLNNFTDNTEEIQETRPQLYKPGISGNPAGRPKGSKNYTALLEQAIKEYETETGKDFFKHIAKLSFTNTRVMLAVLKKFIPDMKPEEYKEQPEPVVIVLHADNKEDMKQLKKLEEEELKALEE